MFLLLRTWSSDEDDKEGYDYAIVEILPDDAKRLALRQKRFDVSIGIDSDLIDMAYKEDFGKCNFFSEKEVLFDSLSDDEMSMFEDTGKVIVGNDFPLPDLEKAHTPELLHVCFGKTGFYWEAYPEYASTIISTDSLELSVLAQMI